MDRKLSLKLIDINDFDDANHAITVINHCTTVRTELGLMYKKERWMVYLLSHRIEAQNVRKAKHGSYIVTYVRTRWMTGSLKVHQ